MKTLDIKDLPIVWQGSVNQWECDQMGHMNTQFYFHRLAEGLGYFAGLIGMPDAFAPKTDMTLDWHRINARFIREARVPAPMQMRMGVVSISKQELTVFAVLFSATDETVMASFLCRLKPVSLIDDEASTFTDANLDIAQTIGVSPPSELLPRTFETSAPSTTVLPDLAAENFCRITSGVFLASSCDGFGKMRIDQPMARLSDGMTVLVADARRVVIEHAPTKPDRPGGAMLETKFDIINQARLGEAFELWSKITHVGPRLISVESWLINPRTKTLLAILNTASAVFDLDARSIVPVTEQAVIEFEKSGIPGSF